MFKKQKIKFKFISITALGLTALITAPACTSAEKDKSSEQITMWVRSYTNDISKSMVDEYNKTHSPKVKLSIIPSDSYQQKVGTAAGSNSLPDLLASDVVYSPNYVTQGIYIDMSKEIKELSFYDSLTKAHIEAASNAGKLYGVPFIVDSSLIIYNKDLYSKAGLDPEKGPQNFDEVYTHSKKIRETVGGDTYGFYFAGNCAGCNAYVTMPNAAAAGTPPLKDDGKKVSINNEAFVDTFSLYKKLYDEGIVPESAKNDDGATWTAMFNEGKIGMIPLGTFNYEKLKTAPFDWGVASLTSPDGKEKSTFVGGDIIGITKNSKNQKAAKNFINWILQEEVQVDFVAKSGNLPVRVDLAENKYTAEDERMVETVKGLANGYTPSSTSYGAIFNDANGPWLKGIRDYIFNNKPDALKEAEKAAQDIIDQSS